MTSDTPPPDCLPGDTLFVAGINLSLQKLNSPAQRLPYALAPYVERLDLVGYVNFYGGPPASALNKLRDGLGRLRRERVTAAQEGNVRRITARRLPLPRALDVLLQDVWIYLSLRPALARSYTVGIVAHAENALLAWLLKRSGRVKHLVYNDWDYYPGYVEPRYAGLIARRERIVVRAADGVASVSRPLADLRRSQGAKRTIVVPNGVEFERFNAACAARKPHPPALIYTGSVDERWGIDLPIRALPVLRQSVPDLRLIVVGGGPALTELRTLAGSLGVGEAVRFTGPVPYADLPALLAEADLGLATSRPDPFRQYASPLKIAEYMAAGLPVIASGGGEAEVMIAESGGGAHIPFEVEAFTQAVLPLLTDAARLDSLRRAALAYARARTWDAMGAKLAGFLADIVGRG